MSTEVKNKKKYRIANEHYGLFHNYKLTDFFLLKKDGKKKRTGNIENLRNLLEEALEPYGITFFGSYEESGLQFTGICINTDFSYENEFIFNQIHGFENFNSLIQLVGSDEDCSYDFIYNTDKKNCVLRRHYYQSITARKEYESFTEMMDAIKQKGFLEASNQEA